VEYQTVLLSCKHAAGLQLEPGSPPVAVGSTVLCHICRAPRVVTKAPHARQRRFGGNVHSDDGLVYSDVAPGASQPPGGLTKANHKPPAPQSESKEQEQWNWKRIWLAVAIVLALGLTVCDGWHQTPVGRNDNLPCGGACVQPADPNDHLP
jgi:hypothetical protein